MDFLLQDVQISGIASTAHVIQGCGINYHKDRPNHGFAVFYGGERTFHFHGVARLEVPPKTLIYMPKGSTYTVEYPDNDIHYDEGCYAVNFNCNLPEDAPPFVLKLKNPQQILSLFQGIHRLRKRRPVAYYETCLSDLYKIIALLKEQYNAEYYSTGERRIIRIAEDYIMDTYTQKAISSAYLAEICGISESYLRKLFKKIHHMSPVEYIRQARLTYAKELLESGDYSVTEVSTKSGFNDVSYFSREFKKAYHIAPSRYLKIAEACDRQ